MIETKTKQKPAFALKLWRGPVPAHLVDNLKETIVRMYHESRVDLYLTEKGYADHVWESMVSAIGGQGELWLALQDGRVVGWLLSGYSKEIENQPTFIIRQAWVDPILRRTPKVKEMLGSILVNAKSNLCIHVLIVSSRSTRAYLRWLGPGWKPISTILMGTL